ncbi:MAG: HTH-type transcriptional repressor FabR [Syntrophus sp. SKADARSKE-3]|nr:HTH-type transcriptional repressor FabR [Syntrophus sp. SKADARSKE-3]
MEKTQRKEMEFQYRRSVILAEAVKVFAAKGFYNTTVADIAHASGFAVGSLYSFFESKESLYMTIVAEKMNQMFGQMREAAEKQQDVAGKVRALVTSNFEFVENNVDFYILYFRGDAATLSHGSKALWDQMMAEQLKLGKFLEEIISRGMEERLIKKVDPWYIAFSLTGIVRGVIFAWMMTRRDRPLTEQVNLVMDILWKGVSEDHDMKGEQA